MSHYNREMIFTINSEKNMNTFLNNISNMSIPITELTSSNDLFFTLVIDKNLVISDISIFESGTVIEITFIET